MAPELQALAAMVTGRTLALNAVRACAKQRAAARDLDLGFVDSAVTPIYDNLMATCKVPPHSRPVLDMWLMQYM